MTRETQEMLDRWTKAMDERDIAQRRVCFAATLFVQGKSVNFDDLAGYVAQAVAAERAADQAETEYRASYAQKAAS